MDGNPIKKYEEKMSKPINHLAKELGSIRAGRANPAVLDKVMVDYYGTPTQINQVAVVAVAEARILTITPWDPSLLGLIEKAILMSDVGINPTNDGRMMRLVFPSPTEERRKQLVKDAMKMGEEAKIGIRNIRREAIDEFKAQKKSSEISEDEQKSLEQDIQKITDKKTKEIDSMCEAKSKEIMEL